MELRNKIRLGFLVVGSVMALSCLVSVFEMGRIRRSVGEMISVNVDKINISTQLLEVTDQHVFVLLSQIGIPADSTLTIHSVYEDPQFTHYLQATKTMYTEPMEIALTDTIMYAYAAYMQVMNEAPGIWEQNGYNARRDWYNFRMNPVYLKLRTYVQHLVSFEQEQLHKNTIDIQDGFYRSMMPGVIAVVGGVLLLFLLSYFISLYLLTPLEKIQTGVKQTLTYKTRYQVRLDTNDELSDLNESVTKLCDEHNAL